MKKLLAILLLLTPLTAFAYTSPGSPQGYVNDFANVLSAEAETALEELLGGYEQKNGHQIAVVSISELTDETIETYAVKLYKDWGIGSAAQDNGALFLLSVQDREMRIEVGYGLEGALTDIEAKQIIDNIVPPYFRTSDYDGGARAAAVAMMQAIGGETNIVPAKSGGGALGQVWANYFWIFIGLFMWLVSILARSRSWWLGGVVGAVAGGVVWLVWSIIAALPVLVIGGLFLDYIVSKKYKQAAAAGNFHGLWWLGGGKHPWDKGGGWGGFGGGMSGGGGASGRW